jgi:stearoyl-CoA desaturase (Delta-9 desaturase)
MRFNQGTNKSMQRLTQPGKPSKLFHNLFLSLDGHYRIQTASLTEEAQRINILNFLPFITLHLGCFGVYFTGWSWTAVWVALGLYIVRMFAITGFYHRYFSHRSFQTSRFWQFCFGFFGNLAIQKGPLWWAAHHRNHHRQSDQPGDVHSPVQNSFWYSHMGWITTNSNLVTHYQRVKDLACFPELVFLDRFDWFAPTVLWLSLYGLGELLRVQQPALQTSGMQLVVWGWFISTMLLFHGTCTINSLAHQWGSQRYSTQDKSRNNLWLALVTLGEGWHNNHHYYPGSARQGFFWWEIDLTYYALKCLSWLGIVSSLNPVPENIKRHQPLSSSQQKVMPQ